MWLYVLVRTYVRTTLIPNKHKRLNVIRKQGLKKIIIVSLLDQIFFCDPVVSELICCRTRAKRLINEGNTTGGLRKIWTGTPWMYTAYCDEDKSCNKQFDWWKLIELSFSFAYLRTRWNADSSGVSDRDDETIKFPHVYRTGCTAVLYISCS